MEKYEQFQGAGQNQANRANYLALDLSLGFNSRLHWACVGIELDKDGFVDFVRESRRPFPHFTYKSDKLKMKFHVYLLESHI